MKTDNTAYRSAVGLRSRPNPWFFTYLELLCIMLLCILG
jgi:hypothetical protein